MQVTKFHYVCFCGRSYLVQLNRTTVRYSRRKLRWFAKLTVKVSRANVLCPYRLCRLICLVAVFDECCMRITPCFIVYHLQFLNRHTLFIAAVLYSSNIVLYPQPMSIQVHRPATMGSAYHLPRTAPLDAARTIPALAM